MGIQASNGSVAVEIDPPSYFRDGGYTGWMLAHIILMLGAWVTVMPLAIMLSIARSRYNLPVQIAFHIVNGLGVFTGFIYNHATPDLYESSSHHPLGWIVTAFTIVWTLLAAANAYVERK